MKPVDEIDECPRCGLKIEGVAAPARVDGRMEWCCVPCATGVLVLP
jgi:hypothetical protein